MELERERKLAFCFSPATHVIKSAAEGGGWRMALAFAFWLLPRLSNLSRHFLALDY